MSEAVNTGTPLYGSEASADDQQTAFTNGEVPVAVYGLGKMGLPLASVYAEVTGNVTGADVDPDVVAGLNAGENHIAGEPGLDELVDDLVSRDAFRAVADPKEAATDARVHVVIVPTLIDDNGAPDLSIVESVMRDIASGLEEGDMVIAESTLPPRSCVDRLLPILEDESGLELGEFGLAFCPERTSSGRALEDIRGAYPKIVGGADEESTRVAELIYGHLNTNEIITVSDTTTAEAVKVFEGVYRDVNIGLANELAQHTEAFDIDVTEAIEAANTQPFCEIHAPGAGVGGHCIPYYPRFIMKEFDTETPVMRAARDTNDEMPLYTADHAVDGLHAEGVDPAESTALVLGLTYRPGVDEIRATPALPLVERLVEEGVDVDAVDPVNTHTEPFEAAGANLVDLDGVAETYDAVVLVTPQEAFDDLDLTSLAPQDGRLVVVDGRQSLTELRGHDAVHYRGVGVNV
ncbi:UDP-N-acetyl-D-mannosaminuronic acid dehydrogenase [Halogranum amylolyticum]|uniref:UDP-N-acetyl-D-mannosamine dehydrogenase n=1 Tax=Halogranum amylolyticum TaxID=660520 RepID=A0A1H8W4J0_9EURY|nr:nucleotide sugar dehydrogenase [Halogranum amylolyticum]SEP22463.1 UDP-N-acetyl-D-mannosaminuronic acid dehydrogenase [Halogranum amylolyticum]